MSNMWTGEKLCWKFDVTLRLPKFIGALITTFKMVHTNLLLFLKNKAPTTMRFIFHRHVMKGHRDHLS